MSGPKWRQVDRIARFRKAMDTGPIPTVTAVDAVPLPTVHGPDVTVWTEDAEGHRRAWHVAADGSLHESPESATSSVLRAAERAVGGGR